MRKIGLIAARDYLATVRTKGFIIGLVLAPILMGGGALGAALMQKHTDTRDRRIAVVDRSGQLGAALVRAADERNQKEVHDAKTGRKLRPAYVIELVPPDPREPAAQRLALSGQVRAQQLHAFVEIGEAVVHPPAQGEGGRVGYYSQNASLDEVRRWLGNPLNNELRRLRLREVGVDVDAVPDLLRWAEVAPMRLDEVDAATGATKPGGRSHELETIGVPMALQMMMFMMIMMGASPLLNAVMEEKAQRIAEVLLGSVRPTELMAGKLVAGVAVAFTAAAVYVGGAAFLLGQLGLFGYVPLRLLPWFGINLFMAVLMLGSIMSAFGAICTDPRDAQAMTLPAILPVLVPMFVMLPVIEEPLSPLATVLSLVPPFTPTLMLLRQSATTTLPAWQPWAGLLGMLAFTLLAVWTAGRIFRIGILVQGKRPSFREVVQWIFQV